MPTDNKTIMYNYSGVAIATMSVAPAIQDYPSCQREYVWPKSMRERLIDSILRGLPIPPVTVLYAGKTLTGERFWIVDGQQRVKTVLSYLNDEFATARQFRDEPGITPISPGKRYSELSMADRSTFNAYELQVCRIANVDVEMTGLVYRRLNYQVELTNAEKLYSYNSATRDAAVILSESLAWDAIYSGGGRRKQLFSMGIYVLMMELLGVFTNMTTPRLADTAFGIKDGLIADDTNERMKRTLDGVANVFDGIGMRAITEIIPVYQAAILLREAGFDLVKSQRGCLAPWYIGIRAEADSKRDSSGDRDILWQLGKVNAQRVFWTRQLDALFAVPGLFRQDARRFFVPIQIQRAWIAQGGICPLCNKPVRYQDAVGHHVVGYANGGMTSDDNCAAVHKACNGSAGSPSPTLPLPDMGAAAD